MSKRICLRRFFGPCCCLADTRCRRHLRLTAKREGLMFSLSGDAMAITVK
jgi:hypothetical protein